MIDERIKSLAVAWCIEAETMLKAAVNTSSIADIKRQVEQGAILFEVRHVLNLVGFYVLRIDHLAEHSEAVLIAACGYHKDFDLTASIMPMIESQVQGCRFLRVHTARPGLVKKLATIGYTPQEFVMRKALNV